MSYETSKGRVREIYKFVEPGAVVQGDDAKGCRDGYGCSGGNGTYVLWGTQRIHLYVKVTVYADQCWHYIDIRDEVLERTGWSKLTEGRVRRLNEANLLKKVSLERWGDGEWQFADFDEFDFDV
jgi:hypothetical protein